MMCFRDRAFCTARCAQVNCSRRWTPQLQEEADTWWNPKDDPLMRDGAPVSWMNFRPGWRGLYPPTRPAGRPRPQAGRGEPMTDTVPGSINIYALIHSLHNLRERLPSFTIYDHPKDHPDLFVARLAHLAEAGGAGLDLAFGDPSLERLQTTMEALGLVKLMRQDGDNPVIVETWI